MNELSETETPEVQQADAPAEQPQIDAGESDRPEWLPEKFERPEELAVSYKELEKKFYERKDSFLKSVEEEYTANLRADVPASPADYSLDLEIPEGVDPGLIDGDPLVDWFRQKAHDMGLKQDQFATLVKEYNEVDQARINWDTEQEALGEHATRRLDRVEGWAKANLSEEIYQTFASLPATAQNIVMFENLMELNGQPKFNMVSESEHQGTISKEDLNEMIQDPQYWRDKNPAFIAKVRAASNKLVTNRGGSITRPANMGNVN